VLIQPSQILHLPFLVPFFSVAMLFPLLDVFRSPATAPQPHFDLHLEKNGRSKLSLYHLSAQDHDLSLDLGKTALVNLLALMGIVIGFQSKNTGFC